MKMKNNKEITFVNNTYSDDEYYYIDCYTSTNGEEDDTGFVVCTIDKKNGYIQWREDIDYSSVINNKLIQDAIYNIIKTIKK